jgi:hypothetical protein
VPPLSVPWHRSRALGLSLGSLVPTMAGRLLLGRVGRVQVARTVRNWSRLRRSSSRRRRNRSAAAWSPTASAWAWKSRYITSASKGLLFEARCFTGAEAGPRAGPGGHVRAVPGAPADRRTRPHLAPRKPGGRPGRPKRGKRYASWRWTRSGRKTDMTSRTESTPAAALWSSTTRCRMRRSCISAAATATSQLGEAVTTGVVM